MLLNAGADPSLTDKFDQSALYHAASNGLGLVVRRFESLGFNVLSHYSLLDFLYCWPRHALKWQTTGYRQVLDIMLSHAPDLETLSDDNKQNTALHFAAKEGNEYAIDKLLASGANPNATNSYNAQPLAIIANYAWRSQTPCFNGIKALVDANARLDNLDTTPNAQTALGWTTIYGGNSLAVVELLLSAGANPNQANHLGQIPLMFAAKNNRCDLVELLLSCGADLSITDNKGNNALDHAKIYKREAVMSQLTRCRK